MEAAAPSFPLVTNDGLEGWRGSMREENDISNTFNNEVNFFKKRMMT